MTSKSQNHTENNKKLRTTTELKKEEEDRKRGSIDGGGGNWLAEVPGEERTGHSSGKTALFHTNRRLLGGKVGSDENAKAHWEQQERPKETEDNDRVEENRKQTEEEQEHEDAESNRKDHQEQPWERKGNKEQWKKENRLVIRKQTEINEILKDGKDLYDHALSLNYSSWNLSIFVDLHGLQMEFANLGSKAE